MESLGVLQYGFRYEFILLLYSLTALGILTYTDAISFRVNRKNLIILLVLLLYPVASNLNMFVSNYDLGYSTKYRLSDTIPLILFFFPLIFFRAKPSSFAEVESKMFVAFGVISTVIPFTSLFLDFRYQSLMFLQFGLFFIFLSYRSPFLSIITTVPALLFSGKRTMLFLIFVFRGGNVKYIFFSFLFLCACYYLGFMPTKLTTSIAYILGNYEDLAKLLAYFPRLREVDAVIFDLNSSGIFAWLFGFGSGYYYTIADSSGIITVTHNVHFSPLGLISTYGAIYACLLYSFFINAIIKYPTVSFSDKVWRAYAMFALIHSFFAYSLFIDFLLFFAIWRRVR